MGSWRNSFETVDEWLESDVWFCARDRVEHEEAGLGFSKIEPYKHVITRCRKQVEAKKRIRPRRVERWCNVRPVACESLCIRAFEGTRFARQNELKTFYVSYSFSLFLSVSNGIQATQDWPFDRWRTVLEPPRQVIWRFLNEPRKSYKSRETRESIMAFFSPSYTRFNEPFLRWLSPKFPVDISFPM